MIANTQYIDWSKVLTVGKDLVDGALEGAKDGFLGAIGDTPEVKQAVKKAAVLETQKSVGKWITENLIIVIPAALAAIYGIYKILKRK